METIKVCRRLKCEYKWKLYLIYLNRIAARMSFSDYKPSFLNFIIVFYNELLFIQGANLKTI